MSKGLEKCEEAFRRIVIGKPHVENHVGLPNHKITAGVVSFEAGFDRGYLKRSRPIHRALIAKIDAYHSESAKTGISKVHEIKRYKEKIKRLVQTEAMANERSYKLSAQNLILIERIRELEKQVGKIQNIRRL